MADAIETVDMASEEFAEYVTLKKVVVQDADGLPDPSQADAKTLYLVPKQKTGVDEGSWWDLYVVIGGSWANLSAVDKAGLVRLVNGKTPGANGAVVLKASDIAYDEPQGGAPEGSVGAKIAAVSATAASAASTAASKYSKPSDGIPSTDMASGVQTSLGKADSAVQPGDILDGGFIKASVLPSFVDDVLEYASADAFPQTGETGKIYVAKDTNKAYRWSGTQYVEISKGVDVVDPANATVTGKAADALKVKQALAGKATKADATLNDVSEEWSFAPATFERGGETHQWSDYAPHYEPEAFEYEGATYNPGWYGSRPDGESGPYEWNGDGHDALTVSTYYDGEVVATRASAHGLRLGPYSASNPNRDKPLASEAEAEALRQGKQDALTEQQITNIAAVPSKADKSEMSVTPGTGANADKTTIQLKSGTSATVLTAHQQLNSNIGAFQWSVFPDGMDLEIRWNSLAENWVLMQGSSAVSYDGEGNSESLSLSWAAADNMLGVDVTATRQMAGWALGTQTDKPLATAAQGARAMTAVQPDALNAALPYSQTAATGSASLSLSARSANRYDLSAVTGTVSVTLPTVTSGECADVVATIVTGATVPTLTFTDATGSPVFIPATADWQTLAASSYNVFSFTSTGASDEWIVGRITSALPSA